jgi:hypothetical protein
VLFAVMALGDAHVSGSVGISARRNQPSVSQVYAPPVFRENCFVSVMIFAYGLN